MTTQIDGRLKIKASSRVGRFQIGKQNGLRYFKFGETLPAMQGTPVQFLGQEGTGYPLQYSWASLLAQLVKNLPAMWKT